MKTNNYNNIPAELKALSNWVGFRVWWDEKEEKLRKMPVDIRATVAAKKADPTKWKDEPAESNNPKTWCDFETASAWVSAKKPQGKNTYHLGFAFDGSGLCGIDLDKCIGEDGNFSDLAKEVLEAVDSYAEYSPSGCGVHIIARHSKPFAARKNAEIEVYYSGRFFTMTGAALDGRVAEVKDCTDAVLDCIAKHFSSQNGETADGVLLPLSPQEANRIKALRLQEPPSNRLSDREIIDKASGSRRRGAEFSALYSGAWQSLGFPSQSEADLALCGQLAFWTAKDFSSIDRIFRSSGLYRLKWDKVHYGGSVTYGEHTVAKAISDCKTTYGDKTAFKAKSASVQGQGTTAAVNASQPPVSGVFVDGNTYFMSKGKDVKRLTNFIFEPIEIVVEDGERSMNARLVNSRGDTAVKRLRFADFNSTTAMKNAIGSDSLGFIITCSEAEFQHIRDFVAQLPCSEKRGVKGISIEFLENEDGFKKPIFVCKDGAFGSGWQPDNRLVQIGGSVKIESDIHIPHPITKEDLLTIGKVLFVYNELPKTAAVLCFTAGCFLKPHLMQSDIKYPHLIMSGEAGSGKSTSFAKVIKPIFSLEKASNVGEITGFTFLADACSSNFLPFVAEEYKPWEMSKANIDMIHGALRNLYDGQKGERGRADQTVVKYFMTAVMVLIGEASPTQTAIKERSIDILFSKTDLIGRKHFDERLDRIQSLLRSFGKSLLLAALDETPLNIKALFKQLMESVPKDFEPRYRNNIAAVLLGLYLIKQVCKKAGAEFSEVFGLEPIEVKDAIIKAVRDYTMDDGKSKSVIEYTLEIMDRMTPTILKNDCHFALHHGGKQLCFNFKAIYDLYTEYLSRHSIEAEKLAYTAFTKQLRKKSYFKNYAAVKLRPEPFANKKENYQCFWLDIEELREACEMERILAEVGYKPPVPPKPICRQLKMGDGDDAA